MATPKEQLVGRTVAGKYAIESYVGGGAMGAVYKARQIALDKAVALKILHRELTANESLAARFHREARAASKLDHPNSIRVIDYGEEPDGLLYIAMELIEGIDLQHVIADEWPLDERRIVRIVSQALAAIAVAHDLGVLHRDLKPENILVQRSTDDDGQPIDAVKVCDFGIAKIAEPRSDHGAGHVPTPITATGFAIGTPEYMSPEQARGNPTDARSDLYSIGVVLYQMLTRTLPFQAESAIGVAVKQIFEEPNDPSTLGLALNPALVAVSLKALRKNPSERYQTAREMRADLRAAIGEAARDAGPASSQPRIVTPPERHAITDLERAETLVPGQQRDADRDGIRPTLEAQLTPRSEMPSRPPRAAKRQRYNLVLFAVTCVLIALAIFKAVRSGPTAADAQRAAIAPGPAAHTEQAGVTAAATIAPAPAAAGASSGSAASTNAQAAPSAPAQAPIGAPIAAVDSTAPRPLRAQPIGAATAEREEPPSPGVPAAAAPPSEPPAPPAATATAPPVAPLPPPPAVTATAPPVAPLPPPAPSPAPSPALDLDAARVAFGGVTTTNGLPASSVRSALSHAGLTRCYKDALRAAGAAAGGTATLRLAMDDTGRITSATASGMDFLPGARACVEAAARAVRVANVDTGDATAQVTLTFSPK